MLNLDRLNLFPNQGTDGDPTECAGITVAVIASNIDGIPYTPDWNYASAFRLLNQTPTTGGEDPWNTMQAACFYGCLPAKDADFTSKTVGELYAANWRNYTQNDVQEALQHQQKPPMSLGVDYDTVAAYMARTGWGVAITMQWHDDFALPLNSVLQMPMSAAFTTHCVAALKIDERGIGVNSWQGQGYGDNGYVYLTRDVFNRCVTSCHAFNPNGNRWLAIVGFIISNLSIPPSMTNALINAGDNNPDVLSPDWSDPIQAHHNVRVLCDLTGLTYEQKEVLTACVAIESNFLINAVHPNYAFRSDGTKYIASTDYGIVQVNDYWHIGEGKDFPSVEYVLANPQACVQWMCNYYKQNGNLNAWCSFTSGAYKSRLGTV